MLDRTFLAVTAAVLATPTVDHPRNGYESAKIHALTWSESSQLELEDIAQSVNGVDMDLGAPAMTISTERSVKIVDEYTSVEEGVLVERIRSFEELGGESSLELEVMGETESHGLNLSSPLEGEAVICEWDADEERHIFQFDEGSDGEESLLEGLLSDAEFAAIPPDEGVEEGNSWTVDLAGQRSFFAPGGSFGWEPELDSDRYRLIEPWQMVAISMASLSDASQEVKGDLECTWSETREVDGARVAVITLELEAELMAEAAEELTRRAEAAELPSLEATCDISWSLEGKGQVLWDLDSGHFLSLELECDSEVEIELGLEMEFGSIEVQAEFSGTTTVEADSE